MGKHTSERKEGFKFWIKRNLFNFFPAYRRTGGRISFISNDWREVHVKLKLTWATRNYVGTVFGGSIYGALDPIFMLQLINILGDKFIVWDKSASVKFIRPIKQEVFAKFIVSDELVATIKKEVELKNEITIELPIHFSDQNNTIYAKVIKELYIANKEFYKQKMSKKLSN